MIDWSIKVQDLLKCPHALKICMKYNVKLITCGDPFWGTLEDLITVSNTEKNEEMLKELNEACKDLI